MKIGIIGKMCSGKSTCAKYLKKKHNFKILSFGDPVKKYARDIFNLDNSIKNREIFIKFGQKLREIDNLVWVKYLKNKIPNDKTQNIVVDDLRFHSEYEELKKLGFVFLKLEISPEYQEKRIIETYPENFKEHLKYVNDISESLADTFDADFVFKVTMNSENDIYMFLDNILNNN